MILYYYYYCFLSRCVCTCTDIPRACVCLSVFLSVCPLQVGDMAVYCLPVLLEIVKKGDLPPSLLPLYFLSTSIYIYKYAHKHIYTHIYDLMPFIPAISAGGRFVESDLDGLRKSFKDAIMEARASWDQKVQQQTDD